MQQFTSSSHSSFSSTFIFFAFFCFNPQPPYWLLVMTWAWVKAPVPLVSVERLLVSHTSLSFDGCIRVTDLHKESFWYVSSTGKLLLYRKANTLVCLVFRNFEAQGKYARWAWVFCSRLRVVFERPCDICRKNSRFMCLYVRLRPKFALNDSSHERVQAFSLLELNSTQAAALIW